MWFFPPVLAKVEPAEEQQEGKNNDRHTDPVGFCERHDRWPDFDAYVREEATKALNEIFGGGTLNCRFTHVYTDGPAPYYSYSGAYRAGDWREQDWQFKQAASDAVMKAGGWARNKFVGTQVAGKTLGVIGLGRIGREVARRAAGLDMLVVALDPFVTAARAAGCRVMTGRDLCIDQAVDAFRLFTGFEPSREHIGAAFDAVIAKRNEAK